MTNYLHWRPWIHLSAPHGLINDPNGLIQINGVYHVFFQWNPSGCLHQNKHWGLSTTCDWLHYSSPKVVLTPEHWFNSHGCYSGSALHQHDGRIICAYTGNVKRLGQRFSYQVYSEFNPCTQHMVQQQVIINKPPHGYTQHFRDPKLFMYNSHNYLVVAAQTTTEQASCLIYRQDEAQQWSLSQKISLELPHPAYMFECPDLILDATGEGFLLGSPQGMPRGLARQQNRYHSGYLQVTGHLCETSHTKNNDLLTTNFTEFDHGFEFYAPQTFFDEDGRWILLAWLGIPEEELAHPSAQDGWCYAMSLPRQLKIDHGQLRQTLLPELSSAFQPRRLNFQMNERNNYSAQTGSHYRLSVYCAYNPLGHPLILRFAENEDDYAEICLSSSKLSWQRSYSLAPDLNGVRYANFNTNEPLKLEIIQDGAVVEIWLNDGLVIMSGYLYAKNSTLSISMTQENFAICTIEYAQICTT